MKQDNVREYEIFLSDLRLEVQEKVLKFLGLESIQAGNLDVLPIATIPKPVEDEENSVVKCGNCDRPAVYISEHRNRCERCNNL